LHPRLNDPLYKECKAAGFAARDLLATHIRTISGVSNCIWVRFTKEEKYGRLMGYIYLVDPKNLAYYDESSLCCLNSWMIDHSYAKEYNGKEKKPDWTKSELSHIVIEAAAIV
jgi:endonuclease YncB( thermonuclease family)